MRRRSWFTQHVQRTVGCPCVSPDFFGEPYGPKAQCSSMIELVNQSHLIQGWRYRKFAGKTWESEHVPSGVAITGMAKNWLSVFASNLIKWPPQGHERCESTASGRIAATSHCTSDIQEAAKFSQSLWSSVMLHRWKGLATKPLSSWAKATWGKLLANGNSK